MEEKKKKERIKKEEEGRGGKKRWDFFEISRKGGPMKRKKITHFNVWFGLG
jgi:hypothetical protein